MRVWAPSWRAHIEVCRVGKGCLGGGSAKGWRQCSCFLVSLSGVTLQGLVDEGPGRCSWMRLQRAKFFDWELLGGGLLSIGGVSALGGLPAAGGAVCAVHRY